MKVVMIHLDGLGYEYLKKSDLSFIKSIPGYLHRMRVFPGYFVNEVSLFTGVHPKNHQLEDLFIFNPSEAFFNGKTYHKLIPKWMLRYITYAYGYHTFLKVDMPTDYFEKFVPVLKHPPRDLPGSFSNILKHHNIKFRYINTLLSNLFVIKKAIKKNDCVYVMDSTYDKLLHKKGVDKIVKTNIDSKIKNLFEFLTKNYGKNFLLILLSDHGMVNVTNKINLSFGNNSDYTYFVDSTILRLWSKKEISLTFNEAIPVESKKVDINGYLFYKKYLAKPGHIFSPNFFQGSKFIKGMHGYGSTNSPHDAFTLVFNPKFKKQYSNVHCSIIDVAPTILKIFKIPIPITMDGVNLI